MTMKNIIQKSFVLCTLLIPAISSQAATYSTGNFYAPFQNPDGNYSIETSGTFWDEFDFNTYNNLNYSQGVSMNISGTHTGMFNDELLLINLNTRQTYTLDDAFDLTIDHLRSRQRFAITGSGLSATDSSITSAYNLSLEAVPFSGSPTPSPVPLPATAWLFASGLLGFVSMHKKRKSVSVTS
jgi:hypothetical protein